MAWSNGDEFCLFRNKRDLEDLRPELAGDEEAVVRCVVGDSVEDGFIVGALIAGQQAFRSIQPMTLPVAGEMRAMRSVCQTLA